MGRVSPFGGDTSGGPVAPPGIYQIQLKTGDAEFTHSFEIIKDPRLNTSPEDFSAQFELWIKIRNRVSDVNTAINRIRRIKLQITELLARENFNNSAEEKSFGEIHKAAEALREKFYTLENELTQNQYETPSDRLRHPTMLKQRMEALVSVVSVADAAPPQQAYSVFEHLSALIDQRLAELSELEEQEVVRLNQQIDQAGIRKLQG